jgi:hypothetical protein
MDLLTLEVDGSLANPYAAGAVALWSVLLSSIAVVLVRRLASPGRAWPPWALLFTAALLVTKPAQPVIGNVLYGIAAQRVVSVGFWEGPPVWVGPVVSGCVAVLTTAILWYQRSRRPSQS